MCVVDVPDILKRTFDAQKKTIMLVLILKGIRGS